MPALLRQATHCLDNITKMHLVKYIWNKYGFVFNVFVLVYCIPTSSLSLFFFKYFNEQRSEKTPGIARGKRFHVSVFFTRTARTTQPHSAYSVVHLITHTITNNKRRPISPSSSYDFFHILRRL